MSMNVKDLIAQRAELDRQIEQAQRAERAEAIAKVKEIMSMHGLTLADLSGRASVKPEKATARKVAAKFRDPETGNTWSGRGLQPKWLRNALAAGRSLADFAV